MAPSSLPNTGAQGQGNHAGPGEQGDGMGRWHGDLRGEQSLAVASPAEVPRLEQTLGAVG
jgi:hypothetical protein